MYFHSFVFTQRNTYYLKLKINVKLFLKKWWRDQESNQGHEDFQSSALPTELSRQQNRQTIVSIKTYQTKTNPLCSKKSKASSFERFGHCFSIKSALE